MIFHENREYATNFPASAVLFTNLNFLAHWHTEIESVYVYDGTLTMGINSEYQILEKGDIAICTSGDIHYYKSNGNSTVLSIVYRPELTDAIIKLPKSIHFKYPFLNRITMEKIGLHESVLKEIELCFRKIFHEMTEQGPYYISFVKSQLAELIALFLRNVPKNSTESANTTFENRSIDLIQRAIKFIEYNYYENITLDSVSSHLGISPTYFSKVFGKITGENFKTYLNSMRIQKVETLLRSTNDSIIDIAYACGFNSIRTFNRVFKALKGIPPSITR